MHLTIDNLSLFSWYLNINFTAPQIGFDPTSYSYDEIAGVARFSITTNMPLRFTDATGALFYTEDGTATGGGGIIMILLPCVHAQGVK